MNRNGYFSFSVYEGATYVTVTPPEGLGKAVEVSQIKEYLTLKNFSYYDTNELISEFNKAGSDGIFKLSDVAIKSYTAFCDYIISPDKMTVTGVLYPPVMGKEIEMAEVERDLESKGIVNGIHIDEIKNIIENRIYNTTFVVAQGSMPTQGKNASIEYLFRTDKIAKPKVMDDGTVDYHNLDLISHVEAEQTVARIIPEEPGIAGVDVFGKSIEPARVKKINFKYARNLYISDDGLSLISKISGQVTLEGDKVFVSNTYEVPVDVDVSTGNIDFDGNVVVKGNVRSGFSVKATGDVTVSGVVEGASIEAGGNVTINRGVQGMSKAEIKAGGDIVSKFIENATVTCKGDLETDSIIHCNVSVGHNVAVKGKNGLIVGGTVRATGNVEAKQIGNEMGTVTQVFVGLDPSVRRRVKELTEIIKKTTEEKAQLNQVVTVLRKKKDIEGGLDAAKTEMLQKAMRSLILLEQQIKQNKTEYEESQKLCVENADSRVKVTGNTYPGVKFSFGNTMHYIKDVRTYCQFVKRSGDITTDVI